MHNVIAEMIERLVIMTRFQDSKGQREDSEAHVKRLKLAGIWDIIVEILKRYELRDKFESNEDWKMLGTKFRKLVKPLETNLRAMTICC
ncbi:EDS1L-like protein [Tanacetum coccineum]